MGKSATDNFAELYRSGMSMAEVAEQVNCSVHKVQYWLDKGKVARRNRSDATYLKRNPEGDPFTIKSPQSFKEAQLLGLGLGLYWGEGTKASPNAVRLGNTDPELLNKFVKFLVEICGVDKDRLRFGLQIFSDIDPREALGYWVRHLGVSQNQFYPKIIVSPPQGKGTYRRKLKYGVVTVYFNNKKLKDALVEMLV